MKLKFAFFCIVNQQRVRVSWVVHSRQVGAYFGSWSLSPCNVAKISRCRLRKTQSVCLHSGSHQSVNNSLTLLLLFIIDNKLLPSNPLACVCFQYVTSTGSSKTWSCFTASGRTTARSHWTVKPKSSWGGRGSMRSMSTHKPPSICNTVPATQQIDFLPPSFQSVALMELFKCYA